MIKLFSINSDILLNGVKKVNKINNNTTLDILKNILFKLSDNGFTIRKTNLETDIVVNLNIDEEIGLEHFSISLDAEILSKVLPQLKNQTLDFYIKENNLCVVKHGKNNFEMPIGDVLSYPKQNESELSNSFVIESDKLFKALSLASNFCSSDDLRPVLNSLNICFNNGSLDFASTDAHKLFLNSYKNTEIKDNFSLNIPKGAFSSIMYLIDEKVNENVIVNFNDSFIKFSFKSGTIYVRLIDGIYPNYRSIIPKEFKSLITFNKVILLNRISNVKFALPYSNALTLTHINKDFNIHAENIDYNNYAISSFGKNDFYADEKCNDDFKVSFNYNILYTCVNSLKHEEIEFCFTGDKKASYFKPKDKDDNFSELYLLMPYL